MLSGPHFLLTLMSEVRDQRQGSEVGVGTAVKFHEAPRLS